LTPALEIHNLNKKFGQRSVLSGASMRVLPGERVAVVGESGAGKSSLLNLIAGLDTADAGSISVGGAEMTGPTTSEDTRTRLRRSQIGFVFQAFHVLPHLSLAQNVELPLALLGVAADERRRRARDMLAAVGLGERADSAPKELSGGELQRVAIARALVHRPALVLADEPTGNLDPETAAAMLDLIARCVHQAQAACVLVTHSAQAAASCDRVLALERGLLREQ
jgi:putative ABC transport system ATP-binding protein